MIDYIDFASNVFNIQDPKIEQLVVFFKHNRNQSSCIKFNLINDYTQLQIDHVLLIAGYIGPASVTAVTTDRITRGVLYS